VCSQVWVKEDVLAPAELAGELLSWQLVSQGALAGGRWVSAGSTHSHRSLASRASCLHPVRDLLACLALPIQAPVLKPTCW